MYWRGLSAECEYVKLILQSYCGSGFHTVRLPVYVWKAIAAAIELDFIFQRQPMPSYRSFHFDAYYNSFTQTWEESQQPITPTCIQFTSALPQTLTPPCSTLHCTLFFLLSILSDERWKGRKKNLKSRSVHAYMYNSQSDDTQIKHNGRWQFLEC